MPVRPLPALLPAAWIVALATLPLAACDASGEDGDADRVTGVWEATVPFRADTVLADENYRVRADYAVHLRFDVAHDDGLAWGTVTARLDGRVVAREAGTVADTFYLDPDEPIVSQFYGTYSRPTLELDVPFGPYDEDLWTFEKVASRLDLQTDIVHSWRFTTRHTASPGEFTFELPMAGSVSVRRVEGEAPSVTDPVMPTQIPGALLTATSPGQNAVLADFRMRR